MGDFEFLKFLEKGWASDFSHEKRGVGKIGEIVLKKGGLTYFHTNQPFSVLCLVTLFPSILFVFHGKNLLLLNLINRYMTSTSK